MQKKTVVLLCILLLKIVSQYLLFHPEFELHRDEFLHLDQGKHLAWGYISVPPMTSWFSALIHVLGDGFFWVKFFPALFGALTIFIIWKTVEELQGNLFACVLASLSFLFSAVLRINLLYQPNSFDIFFWTLTYFLLIKYVNTERPRWLYAAGLSLGFGFLGKYNIAFLAAGLLPTLLLFPQRKIFLNKHFYGALLIAFLLVLPNLLWQYQHHFPTLAQLKELNDTQLVNVNRFDFLKEQLLFFLNSSFVLVASFVALLIYPPFRKYRFFFFSYLFTMALFVFFKAKNYYALGLYPVLLAFGAVYLEKLFSSGWRYSLRYVSVAVLIILFIPLLLLAFPIFSPKFMADHPQYYKPLGMLRWEDGKDHHLQQDFADMLGWKELAQKTDSAYLQLAKTGNTLVLCDNYGQAGAVNYYSSLNDMKAVSFNADYTNWMPLDKPIQNVVLVKDLTDKDTARTRERAFFQSVSIFGQVEDPYARERGSKIFLLQGATVDVNAILADEARSRQGLRP